VLPKKKKSRHSPVSNSVRLFDSHLPYKVASSFYTPSHFEICYFGFWNGTRSVGNDYPVGRTTQQLFDSRKEQIFLQPKLPTPAPEPTQTPGHRGLFPGSKAAKASMPTNHLYLSAEVKNNCSYTCAPTYAFMACTWTTLRY
jgi:hypothetical protein